jgi:DNA (cytosine-5)-methyltransferase 1
MSVYYNEHDPFAAAWLRELIKEGVIADGEVDERDIQTVQAEELRRFTQCHFVAGIGGWSYALRLAGWPDDRPVWTGSCPCQPFSAAGTNLGADDPRHLWPAWFELIRQCRPAVIFGEQVAAAVNHGWIDLVFDDLEREGYAAGAVDLPACGVGAFHIRQRLWFVADTDHAGREPVARHVASSIATRVEPTRRKGRIQPRADGASADFVADTTHANGRSRERGTQAGARSDRERRRRPAGSRADDSSAVADAVSERGRSGQPRREDASDAREPGQTGDVANTRHGSRGRRAEPSQSERAEAANDSHLGESDGTGPQGSHDHGEPSRGVQHGIAESGAIIWSDVEWIACRDGKARPVKPGIFPLAHGVSNRVGTLRGAGNAIVPEVAAEVIAAYCAVRKTTS